MKLKNILLVVKDIEQSKAFYKDLFGLHVIADLDGNIVLSEGLVLQEQNVWSTFIQRPITMGGNDAELYFEDNRIDDFIEKLKQSNYQISYISQTEHAWGQKVVRIYDLDQHIIEIGESMEYVIRRFLQSGMSAVEVAKKTGYAEDYIQAMTQKSNSELALAIDIGGTSVKYGYVSETGKITQKNKFKTEKITDLQEFLDYLKMVVEEAVEQGIRCVGISSLGIFDEEGLCCGGVENLSFLDGVNLNAYIKSWYPTLQSSIINDGTAAAVGEYWLGEGVECDNFICITLGTGIGGAIVINGIPVLGSHYQSGEIGYTNYKSEHEYLERFYSTKGILKEAASRLQLEKIGGKEFTELVRKDEEVCVNLFEEWMNVLADMIANHVLLLDPEKVIIGGGISGEKEWICNQLDRKLQARLPEALRGKAKVCVAKNGNDAGLLGAVEGYFRM